MRTESAERRDTLKNGASDFPTHAVLRKRRGHREFLTSTSKSRTIAGWPHGARDIDQGQPCSSGDTREFIRFCFVERRITAQIRIWCVRLKKRREARANGLRQPALISRKHHETQHDEKEDDRVKKKSDWRGASTVRRQVSQKSTQHPIYDLVCFWIRNQEKYKRAVKTILCF